MGRLGGWIGIAAIVPLVLLAGSADTLTAGAVCIAVVLWQIRRHSVLFPHAESVAPQIITAVPEVEAAPRAPVGSERRVLPGLSAPALPIAIRRDMKHANH